MTSVTLLYVSVICFALVPSGTLLLARANGWNHVLALAISFGPIVWFFAFYWVVAVFAGQHQDWGHTGPVLLCLTFILNFWQTLTYIRSSKKGC